MNKILLLIPFTFLAFNISCKKDPTSSKNTAPIASFIITPASGGTTATVFTFDASQCTDNEDGASALEVRWDWNNDGTWDTDYSTTKTATHQYAATGTYTVKLEVKDSEGLTNTITKTVSLANTEPTASFTVDPSTGTVITTFIFDASSSSDIEDASNHLQFRWDWENDGDYDTDFSTTNIATHQYTIEGDHIVNLEVRDTEGLTHSITMQITVTTYIVQYTGTVNDIDGNEYNTIQIGNQLWMAENLKVTNYRNGEPIPKISGCCDWEFLQSGAFLNYDDDENYALLYGRLYNWFVIDDPRGIAPQGWHVPSDDEWKELEMYLGMSQADADGGDATFLRNTGNVGQKLKSASGWYNGINNESDVDPEVIGTNESGFSALAAGYAGNYGLTFDMGYGVIYWTSTDIIGGTAWRRGLGNGSNGVLRYNNGKNYGFSIRCIKD